MPTPALELRQVSYALNGQKILDNISWQVAPREHWAILGPNGAGKTTLLKIICGYLWPNAGGSIKRLGQSLLDLRELRRSIGWVNVHLLANIPASEKVLETVLSGKYAQVGFFKFWGDLPSKLDYEMAEDYLEDLGCSHLKDQNFGTLSQGEQQKVLIARARMAKPYLIILDEPCVGLDPGARENFLRTLQILGTQENTPNLVYVTHHIEEIMPIFKKTLVLKDGKIMAWGKREEIIKPDILEDLYGISFKVIKKKGRFWPISS
ncbi:MAG: ABC transporter ATP-binding protein [Thermodesulfobacteriota bacterium]